MKSSRYKIVIIEPSDVLAEGLRSLLSEENFSVISVYKSVADFSNGFLGRADAVLIDTVCLRPEEQNRPQEISGVSKISVIAVNRGDYPEQELRFYDASVNIFEGREKIARCLLSTLESEETVPQYERNELSEREKEILVEVARGKTNKEIASELNLSVHTVMTHRKNISHKTGITSISGLTVYAIINKLVDLSQL